MGVVKFIYLPSELTDASNPEVVKTLKNAYNYYQDAAVNYAEVCMDVLKHCHMLTPRMIV